MAPRALVRRVFPMAEQYPHDQPDARQPDVVVFSPELLKMVDAHEERPQNERVRPNTFRD